jgi:hypothetical protein
LSEAKRDVHGAGHGGTNTNRRAIDGADDGFFALEHSQSDLATRIAYPIDDGGVIQLVLHVFEGGTQLLVQAKHIALDAQVHTCAKRFACTGHHNRGHSVIVACAIEGVNQFVRHLHSERIHVVGAVQGEGEDVVGYLVAQGGVVGHGEKGLGEGGHVNHEAVFHIAVLHAFIGLVDAIHGYQLYL